MLHPLRACTPHCNSPYRIRSSSIKHHPLSAHPLPPNPPKVAVRVRPVQQQAARDEKCLHILSKKSLLFDDGSSTTATGPSSNKNTSRPRKYTYDHVFAEDATQDEVYQTTTSPLIKDVLRGLSAAVFAYGATGSGKTHTMLGPNPRKAATPVDGPPKTSGTAGPGSGLMVKAIDEIFRHVEAAENPAAYRVRCIIMIISSRNDDKIASEVRMYFI